MRSGKKLFADKVFANDISKAAHDTKEVYPPPPLQDLRQSSARLPTRPRGYPLPPLPPKHHLGTLFTRLHLRYGDRGGGKTIMQGSEAVAQYWTIPTGGNYLLM